VCDLGYLRHVYRKPEGSLGYRCPAEPVNAYERKGGKAEQTLGRKCLCNGLLANIGIPQCHASGYVEKMLLTAGDDLKKLSPLVEQSGDSYSARDVVKYLLGSG